MENLVGDKDVAVPKGRKSDPPANFDWARLRKGISRAHALDDFQAPGRFHLHMPTVSTRASC
jgi:N-acetyl-anhydromuramyl-L-alanine amidase AmpD